MWSVGLNIALLMGMFWLGKLYGRDEVRLKLIQIIMGMPKNLCGSKQEDAVLKVKWYVYDKFMEGTRKWNWRLFGLQ